MARLARRYVQASIGRFSSLSCAVKALRSRTLQILPAITLSNAHWHNIGVLGSYTCTQPRRFTGFPKGFANMIR
jgi:hypothetical protein